MTKKDVECQVHMWMVKKAKKPWYIKRGKTEEKWDGEEKEREKENKISRACPKKIYCYIPCSYLESFHTKIQYFGPRSD